MDRPEPASTPDALIEAIQLAWGTYVGGPALADSWRQRRSGRGRHLRPEGLARGAGLTGPCSLVGCWR